jgi:hypothetical protein
MKNPLAVRISSVDRLNDGVIITFDDGKCALYSTDLLYATLDQAQLLEDLLDEEE